MSKNSEEQENQNTELQKPTLPVRTQSSPDEIAEQPTENESVINHTADINNSSLPVITPALEEPIEGGATVSGSLRYAVTRNGPLWLTFNKPVTIKLDLLEINDSPEKGTELAIAIEEQKELATAPQKQPDLIKNALKIVLETEVAAVVVEAEMWFKSGIPDTPLKTGLLASTDLMSSAYYQDIDDLAKKEAELAGDMPHLTE
ncbi:hypothetical protein [Rickettsia endosymbiont of Halotydeus destructor]|uniref:hypothetical protein n=1 Tax=Rickettsia endosymbiont of Halotydeus destructor TaxID=2996754 RepID=UPI003BAF5EB5